jgi:hypothetical protein
MWLQCGQQDQEEESWKTEERMVCHLQKDDWYMVKRGRHESSL